LAKKEQSADVATAVQEKAKDKKAKEKTAAAVADITSMAKVDTSEWQEMLDDMGTESNDPRIYFIKSGRNRIRLVPEDNDPKKFFYKFSRTYEGVTRAKFLIRGVVMGKKSDEAPQIQAISVGKMVVTQILNQLAEGYDLFDPKKGRGVTIVKKGEGREGTSYTTLVSPDAVPLPKGLLDLTDSLAKIAADIQAADDARQAEGTKGRRGAAAKLGKTKAEDDEAGDW